MKHVDSHCSCGCIVELLDYEKLYNVYALSGIFFSKLGFFAGFSLHVIIFVGRISEDARGITALQHYTFRLQLSSVECSVAQKGAA
jgi:hypothetical protein